MAAILNFFPGRNRPRLETSAETGRGMAQGGRKPLLRGSRSMGRASVVGWRGTCRGVGEHLPPRLSPWGKRERGIRFHAAAGSSMLRRLYAHRCFPMCCSMHLHSPMTVTNLYVELSISFPEVSPAPTHRCRASIRTLNGPLLGPVQVGVRSKAQVHHDRDGPGIVGCCHLSQRSFMDQALNTQSPEQGGGCRCLPKLPDSLLVLAPSTHVCSLSPAF